MPEMPDNLTALVLLARDAPGSGDVARAGKRPGSVAPLPLTAKFPVKEQVTPSATTVPNVTCPVAVTVPEPAAG